MRRLYLFALLFFSISCGSDPFKRMDDIADSANPHGSSYAADGFTFRRPRILREDTKYEFYYKHCTMIDRKPYPDSGVFGCTDPF